MKHLAGLRRWKIPGALAAIVALALFLVACGSDEATSTPTTDAPAAATATTAPAATATPTEAPAMGVFPTAGEGGIPASVAKLTVAVDGWGQDDMVPVETRGASFFQDYINVSLLMRETDHSIVGLLATEWELADEGFSFTIHPNAIWQDGTPITSADIQWGIAAMRGDFPEFTGVGEAQRFKDGFDEIVAVDDKRVFMKTKNPIPDFIAWHTGAGYHIFYYGPSEYLQKVGSEGYTKDPLGGGPYTVSDWKPGERLLLERWDDFWGDTAWYHKPQHQELELILTTDEAARFAMIKSDQVDMVVNIPYAVAEKLARSEEAIGRGINPGKGDIWTTAVGATGNMSIVFETLFCPLDCAEKPDPSESKPWDDIRVREALELAVDKVAISRDAHFGFTNPMGGLWFSGSFGYRPELPVSEFNPEKARQLLEEAGYGDGIDADVYYAPFTNSPGQDTWLEAAASYWKDVGINVSIFEIEPAEYYARGFRPVEEGVQGRAFRPLAVMTWGRQEHAGVLVNYGYHRTGSYNCCYDEFTDSLWEKLNTTTDEAFQLDVLAELEDYVLEKRWVMPMDEVSVIQGYTDRVLSHPTAPFAASFEQLWRIVLRD